MPVLSICIPTYNRADILKQSLESLVSQDVFKQTEDIEIVISDNCSTDNTPQVAEKFAAQYGKKVQYFRNPKNVEDKNFSLALERGTGDFLRLCNDTLCFYPDSLVRMLRIVKDNFKEKPVLFFKNDKEIADVEVNSLDDFVKDASFMITWIGGLGIWKEDKTYLSYMKSFTATKLPQTGLLLRMASDKKHAKIVHHQFGYSIRPSTCGDYNLSEIFIKNYLAFYEPYLKSKELSFKVYNKEKWRVLEKHVLPRQFNIKLRFCYDKTLFWKYTKPYHNNIKFYFLIIFGFLRKVKYCFKKLL